MWRYFDAGVLCDEAYAEIKSETRTTPVTAISCSVVVTSVADTNDANTTENGCALRM